MLNFIKIGCIALIMSCLACQSTKPLPDACPGFVQIPTQKLTSIDFFVYPSLIEENMTFHTLISITDPVDFQKNSSIYKYSFSPKQTKDLLSRVSLCTDSKRINNLLAYCELHYSCGRSDQILFDKSHHHPMRDEPDPPILVLIELVKMAKGMTNLNPSDYPFKDKPFPIPSFNIKH